MNAAVFAALVATVPLAIYLLFALYFGKSEKRRPDAWLRHHDANVPYRRRRHSRSPRRHSRSL